MTDRELMRQVLEDICGARLCEVNSMSSRGEAERLLSKAADALRERLAQPQRTWVGLTDEEIDAEWRELDGEASPLFKRVIRKFARAIEAKLKEKNT